MKITLSGLPYSGKGVLGRKLAEMLKIPYFSVGDLRREYAQKQGITIAELNLRAEINPESDKLADEYQVEWAKEHPDFLLEGRLSYHFIPESIKLFLHVSPEEAAKRALLDDRSSERKGRDLEEQMDFNQERCQSDIRRYSKLYGIRNCYNWKNFDIVIDTTPLTREEALEKTLAEIRNVRDKFKKNNS